MASSDTEQPYADLHVHFQRQLCILLLISLFYVGFSSSRPIIPQRHQSVRALHNAPDGSILRETLTNTPAIVLLGRESTYMYKGTFKPFD